MLVPGPEIGAMLFFVGTLLGVNYHALFYVPIDPAKQFFYFLHR